MSDAQDKLQPLLETLIRLIDEMGFCITGFVFGAEPPMLLHFGNATESLNPDKMIELHSELTKMYKENFDKKTVIELKPDRKDWSN